MTVTIYWHDEAVQNILVYELAVPWDLDDLERAITKGRRWMREKPYDVCVIFSVEYISILPRLIASRTKSYMDSRPANTGLVVYVASGILAQALYSAVMRLRPELKQQYLLVNTLQEAIEKAEAWQAIHYRPENR